MTERWKTLSERFHGPTSFTAFGSVEASGHSRVIQVGKLKGNIEITEPQTSASAKAKLADQFTNLSLQCVANYVERSSQQSRLHASFQDNTTQPPKRSTVVVISGFGGAGKTQLALWYAQEFGSEYEGIVWLYVGSGHSLEREVSIIYRWMYPGREDNCSLNDMTVLINSWFKGKHGKWLWIIDNADDVEDDNSPNKIDLMPLLPQAPCVHIIVTTRSKNVHGICSLAPIEMDTMEENEALELFWSSSKLDPTSMSAGALQKAKVIITEASSIPLAVSLAGATISESPRMAQDLQLYIDLHRQNRKTLLSKQPEKLRMQYSESILASWETSYRLLSRKSTLAATLLPFLALLDPRDIFTDLFDEALFWADCFEKNIHCVPEEGRSLHKWWEVFMPRDKSPDMLEIEAALAVLRSFSMIRHDEGLDNYSVHSLVQSWSFERLDEEIQVQLARNSCKFLILIIACSKRDLKTKYRFANHAIHNFQTISGRCAHSENLRRHLIELLEFWTCYQQFFHKLGLYSNCVRMSEFEVEQRSTIQGKEDVHTMSAMESLARILDLQGKSTRSLQIWTTILQSRSMLFEKDHLEILSAREGLAGALSSQRKYEEALLIQREVLAKRKLALPAGHPDIIKTMSNVATTLNFLGQQEEAFSLRHEVLETCKLASEENDEAIILAMYYFARSLSVKGDIEEALSMEMEVLQRLKSTYRNDHPMILQVMHSLIVDLVDLGRPLGAKFLLYNMLVTQEVTGGQHPLIIEPMLHLGILLRDREYYADAEDLLHKTLEKAIEILGEDHPDTLTVMESLSITLNLRGKLGEAVTLGRKSLDISRRALGEQHLFTIRTLEHLATVLYKQNPDNLPEAISLMEEALEKLKRTIGPSHSDTLLATDFLAKLRKASQTGVKP